MGLIAVGGERKQRRVIAVATALIALAYLVGVSLTSGLSRPLVQGDARSYFAYVPSLVLDADLDLRNEFVQLQPNTDPNPYPWGAGTGDLAANPFPVGPALVWLPGYLVGLGADMLAAAAGFDTGPRGYGLFAVWGAALAAIALAGVGAELSRRLAAATIAPEYALPATLLVWIGTPALYYTLVAPLYSHAVAWFAASLALWTAWKAAQEPAAGLGRWLAAGAAGGLLLAIRLQDAPILVVPLALLATLHRRDTQPAGATPADGDEEDGRGGLRTKGHAVERDRIAQAGATAAWAGGVMLGYLPQAWVWYRLHGELVPRQNLGAPGPFSLRRLAAVLFSNGYEGWLSWTPLAAVGVVGLGWLALAPALGSRSRVDIKGEDGKDPGPTAETGQSDADRVAPLRSPAAARWLAGSALVAIAVLVVVDIVHPYGQGAAFGARRYVSVTPLLVLGVTAAIAACGARARLRRPGWIAIGALALAGLWLFVAYELLVLRHGVYPDLTEAWRYALGRWSG